VPVTIALAFLTALLQTAWYRSKKDEYLRLTRFFGTLLVINVAIGRRRSCRLRPGGGCGR
jgi:cytochrome d ubiquinol oxidase subunit I